MKIISKLSCGESGILNISFLITLVFVCFSAPLTWANDTVVPSPDELLKKIIQSRESIQAGHFFVEEKIRIEDKTPTVQQWEVHFEGAKLRIDKNHIETVCLDCYSKFTRLYYSSKKPTSPELQNALAVYDGYEETGVRLATPDPRWFGYLPVSFVGSVYDNAQLIYEYDYEKNGYDMQVSPDSIGDQECWKITFPSPLSLGKSVFTIWVDRNINERIFRVVCRSPSDDVAYLSRLDLQGEMWKEKFWFPTQTTFQRFENGKATRSVETKITILSLGESLPSEIFSPKTIVVPNTPVAWHLDRDRPAPSGELVWDGNEVVAVDNFDNMMRESTRLQPMNLFFVLLGIALILIGVGLKLRKQVR